MCLEQFDHVILLEAEDVYPEDFKGTITPNKYFSRRALVTRGVNACGLVIMRGVTIETL